MTKKPDQVIEGFNPALLTLRRESLGITQEQLAGRLRTSQAKLSRIEAGILEPSERLARAISEELHRPVEFFFQKESVYGPGVSEFHHRMRRAVGARTIRQAHARIGEDLITLRRLLRSADLDTAGFDALRALHELDTPEEAARAVRATWHLPHGPLNNVTEAIENSGGIVLLADFSSVKIDAISRWAPDLPPTFFVSREVPGDRQRLSLAHELGHLILHGAPAPSMEDEANRFAAEFLMPARDIRHELVNISLARLATLKPYWKVSMQALLYRASDLLLVHDRKARYLWMQMGHLGYRKREPAELSIPQEKPVVFAELVDLHRQHLGYTLAQLRDLLLFEQDEIEERYLVHSKPSLDGRPRLRLVR